MHNRRHFIIILSFVIGLAFCIQITRLNTFLKIKGNTPLLETSKISKGETYQVVDTTEKFLVVYDERSEEFIETAKNIGETLGYMRLPYEMIEVQDFNGLTKERRQIIFVLEDISLVEELEEVMDKVYQGAQVFFAYRLAPTPQLESVSSKVGILEVGSFVETHGIRLLDDLLIGGEGVEVKGKELLNNSSVAVQLDPEVKVHAISADKVNLLWSTTYGEGQVFYFNGSMLGERMNRGLISAVASSMSEEGLYPIINAKINYIDDFPSPPPSGFDEQIYEIYGKSIVEFYRDVWWPDMIRIGSRNGLKYTGVAIGTYEDEVNLVQEEDILISSSDVQYYTKDLLASGGEVGVHGYNHQPLTIYSLADRTLGYVAWKDYETITAGIRVLSQFLNYYLPNYKLTTYVPPSNIITDEGIDALVKGNPDIRIIASLYDPGEDEDSYGQELFIDERGLIHLPRLISGFPYTEQMQWMILNGMNTHGYFSHFMHPDDILDPFRSKGKTWEELCKEYAQMQSDVTTTYPWLKPATATEGANQLIKYAQADLSYEKSEDKIVIHNEHFQGELSFLLRTDKVIKEVKNGAAQQIDQGIYLITTKAETTTVLFRRR